MKAFNKRADEAAAMFLSRRGYEIIERTWNEDEPKEPIDIVAMDGDTLVFVIVKGRQSADAGFPESNLDRKTLEAYAIGWFQAHPDQPSDTPFRFDVVALVVVGSDKALIRHHINAMAMGDIDSMEE